jgi:hypothetical protein
VSRKEKTPRKGYGVALGNAMAEFEILLNPAAEHWVEEQRRAKIAPDQAGSSSTRRVARSTSFRPQTRQNSPDAVPRVDDPGLLPLPVWAQS